MLKNHLNDDPREMSCFTCYSLHLCVEMRRKLVVPFAQQELQTDQMCLQHFRMEFANPDLLRWQLLCSELFCNSPNIAEIDAAPFRSLKTY